MTATQLREDAVVPGSTPECVPTGVASRRRCIYG